MFCHIILSTIYFIAGLAYWSDNEPQIFYILLYEVMCDAG